MDGRVIELVSYTKHLGTGVGAEDCVVQNMIKKGRKSFSAILSLDKNIGGTNPAVANKLYWSTVIPSMLYGIQVLCLSEEALDSLEQEHRAFGKRIQCIPTTTSNPAAYRLLGWKSIRAYHDLIVLNFFYKTLQMQCSCIFKRLVLFRIVHLRMSQAKMGGPTSYFLQLCIKYNVLEYVNFLVDTGRSMTFNQWSDACKRAIKQMEDFFFAIELGMCEKLSNMYHLQLDYINGRRWQRPTPNP